MFAVPRDRVLKACLKLLNERIRSASTTSQPWIGQHWIADDRRQQLLDAVPTDPWYGAPRLLKGSMHGKVLELNSCLSFGSERNLPYLPLRLVQSHGPRARSCCVGCIGAACLCGPLGSSCSAARCPPSPSGHSRDRPAKHPRGRPGCLGRSHVELCGTAIQLGGHGPRPPRLPSGETQLHAGD